MKRIRKWLLGCLGLTIGLLILAFVFRGSIVRLVMQHRLSAQIGMPVTIGRFSFSFVPPVVTIGDLRINNTAEFGGVPFLKVPELHIECDPTALANHQLRFKLIRLDMAELDIVKNEAGQTNVLSFRQLTPANPAATNELSAALQGLKFTGIDELNLSLGEAKFIDLKDPAKNRVVSVNLDHQVFKNVKGQDDLYGILFILWLRSGGALSFAPQGLRTLAH